MCVTMSTVGYGDYSPIGGWLQLFTVIWIFVAILAVFPLVTGAIVLFTKHWTDQGRALIEWFLPPKLVDVDGDGEADFKMPERFTAYFFWKNMMPATLLWLKLPKTKLRRRKLRWMKLPWTKPPRTRLP